MKDSYTFDYRVVVVRESPGWPRRSYRWSLEQKVGDWQVEETGRTFTAAGAMQRATSCIGQSARKDRIEARITAAYTYTLPDDRKDQEAIPAKWVG